MRSHVFQSTSVCNLCGKREVTTVSTVDRKGNPLKTVICVFCGIVRTDPVPTDQEIKEFYQQKYWDSYKSDVPKLKRIYRNAHRAVERYYRDQQFFKNAHSILEIGSGCGEFVYLLQYLNLNAQGLEPHRGYSEYSRKEFGVSVTSAMLENASYPLAAFDLIVSHHVVEHLRDPAAELRRMNQWLKEGGYLLIEVPNIEAERHSPNNRFHFAHIYNFNGVALEELAARQGFLLIEEASKNDHEHHLHMIFQKKEIPTGKGKYTEVQLKDNAQHLYQKLLSHTAFRHYLTLTPYSRAIRKIKNSVVEKWTIKKLKRGKDVADGVFSKRTHLF